MDSSTSFEDSIDTTISTNKRPTSAMYKNSKKRIKLLPPISKFAEDENEKIIKLNQTINQQNIVISNQAKIMSVQSTRLDQQIGILMDHHRSLKAQANTIREQQTQIYKQNNTIIKQDNTIFEQDKIIREILEKVNKLEIICDRIITRLDKYEQIHIQNHINVDDMNPCSIKNIIS